MEKKDALQAIEWAVRDLAATYEACKHSKTGPAISIGQFRRLREARAALASLKGATVKSEADARLIAAAPDLLAALEFWFDSTATAAEIATRARAAINKAKGLE